MKGPFVPMYNIVPKIISYFILEISIKSLWLENIPSNFSLICMEIKKIQPFLFAILSQ